MKLRFQNDSLRLRLSQSEVTQLKETGRVENTVSFTQSRYLVYAIEAAPVPELTAAFEGNRLSVVIPTMLARTWIDTDQTGVEGSSGPLHILIEKDFQCLHKVGEEEPDAFPNPLAGKS